MKAPVKLFRLLRRAPKVIAFLTRNLPAVIDALGTVDAAAKRLREIIQATKSQREHDRSRRYSPRVIDAAGDDV